MFNTKFGAKLAARSEQLFGKLDPIARKAGLITRRSRKFSAPGFVLALLKAVVSGKGSFNQLAMNLSPSERAPLTAQALWRRINEKAVMFMMESVGEAMKQRWVKEHVVASQHFSRIIIEDSSQTKLPKDNAENFPAHGNDKGETAGCKFDLAFDLLKGQAISSTLHLATEQDREIGKDVVGLAKKGDLFLRDMGYFSLAEFDYLKKRDAFWLSRVPANVTIRDLSGDKLETVLRTAKSKQIDLEVKVGDVRYPARLLAVKAAPEVAQQRRRERRKKARQKGKTASKDMLLRDGWHLIITNVPRATLGAEDLFKLYSIRWQIEITFRAWKQSSALSKALKRHSNPQHLQVLMYAGMLYLVLTLYVSSLLQQAYPRRVISIEKIAHDFAAFLLRTTTLQDQFSCYSPDPRHIRMDRRARESLHEIAVATLS